MNPKKEANKKLADTIIGNLEKRNIEGYYCEDSKAAVQTALEMMEDGAVVAWGGSETLKETGLLKELRKSDRTLLDRDLAKTPDEKKAIYRESVCADYFLMSSNAITIGGELVNIDGTGNRVACLMHGPEHVILLVGMNKVVSDIPAAVSRVRNFATPANAVRLKTKTPCEKTGSCGNCLVPDCMCCEVVITRRSRQDGRMKVILIGETLGY